MNHYKHFDEITIKAHGQLNYSLRKPLAELKRIRQRHLRTERIILYQNNDRRNCQMFLHTDNNIKRLDRNNVTFFSDTKFVVNHLFTSTYCESRQTVMTGQASLEVYQYLVPILSPVTGNCPS